MMPKVAIYTPGGSKLSEIDDVELDEALDTIRSHMETGDGNVVVIGEYITEFTNVIEDNLS